MDTAPKYSRWVNHGSKMRTLLFYVLVNFLGNLCFVYYLNSAVCALLNHESNIIENCRVRYLIYLNMVHLVPKLHTAICNYTFFFGPSNAKKFLARPPSRGVRRVSCRRRCPARAITWAVLPARTPPSPRGSPVRVRLGSRRHARGKQQMIDGTRISHGAVRPWQSRQSSAHN